jgi:hypothetical protein
MKYRIYGKPLNHDEMVEIVKSKEHRLYGIVDGEGIVPLNPVGIKIDLETKQWEFMFDDLFVIEEGDLVFTSKKSAERYYKRNNYEL